MIAKTIQKTSVSEKTNKNIFLTKETKDKSMIFLFWDLE